MSHYHFFTGFFILQSKCIILQQNCFSIVYICLTYWFKLKNVTLHWYNKKWFYKMLCWWVLSHYHFSFFFNISFTLRHSLALFFWCDIMKWWMDDMVPYWYADFQLFSAFWKSHKNGIVLIWRKRPKIWIFESALIIVCVIRKWQNYFLH